jgi:hypothetical protein
MPMFDDKKKLATIIIGKMSDKEEMKEAPVNEMGDEIDYETALEAASEDMMKAIKEEDAMLFKASLKDFIYLCEEQEDSEEESEEYSEGE